MDSKRIKAIILSNLFLGIIGLLFLNQFTKLIPDKPYDENKQKAAAPKFDVNRLDNFPAKFDAYIIDNFSLRGHFLSTMGFINLNLFHKSPKPDKLIIGKQGWLFSAETEWEFYNFKNALTTNELMAFKNALEYRQQTFDSMGITMYLVINPVKFSIYPEYLPSQFINHDTLNLSHQIVAYLKQNSNLNIIYTKDALLKAKERTLFYKGDNHWNEIGAYYSADTICKILKRDGFEVKTFSLSEFTIDSTQALKGNLAGMTGKPEIFAEPQILLKKNGQDAGEYKLHEYPCINGFPYPWEYQKGFTTNDTALARILIIRDSFGTATIPYLKNAFFTSTFIFDAWQYKQNLDIVKSENPDVVIYMVVENLLPNLIETLSKNQ